MDAMAEIDSTNIDSRNIESGNMESTNTADDIVAPEVERDRRVPAPRARWSWLLVVGPGLIWGCSFLFIDEGLRATSPAGVTFARIAIGLAVMAMIPAARRPIRRDDRSRVALLGVLWIAFPMMMFPFAEQHVSSALTGMLNAATPLFTAIVAASLVRRFPSRSVVAALGVGVVGTVLVAAPSLGHGSSQATAIALILAALVSYGFAINLARPLQQRNGALPVILRALAVAFVLTAPFGGWAALHGNWTIGPALCLLALGGLGTGIANVMVATAAGRGGATHASAMAFIMPTVSLLLGVVIRHEHVAAVSIVGGGVCVGGAYLLSRAKH